MLIEITEQSQAGNARRKAVALAESLQMDETSCGQVALAATEIATNLLKHAGRGHILVQELLRNGNSGLRITGVDKGPGISDVTKALEDGRSTASSMGAGLGAIRRLSHTFELYTVPGGGTVVDAEFWSKRDDKSPPASNLEIACVSEPIRGEDQNGDGWGVRLSAEAMLLMVVDGLGHGPLAAEAAREAERILTETRRTSPEQIIQDTHLSLKKTRGAAQAVTRVDSAKGIISYAGVGNISTSVVSPGSSRSLASYNGTVGQQMEKLQEFSYPWNKNSILVMHSDGLATRWDLERYPGIWRKSPSVIAAVLHRDFCRGRDDVTVLVARAA
jgi:anti-sigma regulatory factor (Ser/Thr protein kinase)